MEKHDLFRPYEVFTEGKRGQRGYGKPDWRTLLIGRDDIPMAPGVTNPRIKRQCYGYPDQNRPGFVAGPIPPTAIGIAIGWLLFLSQFLIEGIHRLDRWYYFGVSSVLGAIGGLLGGIGWALQNRWSR